MKRIDILIYEKGLTSSRSKAKELIENSQISVNNKIITKPSEKIDEDADISIIGKKLRYVGKGGLKLEKSISAFNINLIDCVCIDFGASTGGFTDCMLQNGAKKVYAIDVGQGQLDKKLLDNKKVINLEKTNIKTVSNNMFDESIDFCSIDLSFISIKFAIKVVYNVLKENGEAVFLIKPQFEAGKQRIGKNGIVKDTKVHKAVIQDLLPIFISNKLSVLDLTYSPITGGDGNIEYLIHVKKSNAVTHNNINIDNIINEARKNFKKEDKIWKHI